MKLVWKKGKEGSRLPPKQNEPSSEMKCGDSNANEKDYDEKNIKD